MKKILAMKRIKTMKKIIVSVSICLIIVALLFGFSACKNNTEADSILLQISGDIEGYSVKFNLNTIDKPQFSYEKDNETIVTNGYLLSEILNNIELLSDTNWILLTATDGVSARVDAESANLIYIVYEEAKLNIKAPSHPRVVGIKNLAEITVIEKESSDIGLKIINEQERTYLSYGNLRLNFFEQTSENRLNDIVAYKHVLKDSYKISDLTNDEKNILFFNNQDIIKTNNDDVLLWVDGMVAYSINGTIIKGIKGIISGVEYVLFDAYYEMKNALDNDKQVMFILPDGFSLQQVQHYQDELSLFAEGYNISSSVDPAISNVSLASIVTGKSPYDTGITERGIAKPAYADIFDYALSLEKTVSYIEGNGNLIITNVQPDYNMPDVDGYTDSNVFSSAMQAKSESPDLLFVHFHGIDDVNHEYSPISEEAKAKILETEDYIEQLIEGFDGVVIILPDHGALTYYDEEDNAKGHHGFFEKDDMLIPYYVIEAD